MVTLSKLGRRSIGFALRQTANFKLMLARRTIQAMGTGLSIQYNSIYATALGASPVQLGSLQSVGNAIGALVALPAGWLIDSTGLRKVFLAGTAILGASAALYLLAPHWTYLYAAIILYYVGTRITCTSCTVTCANELPNEERATGRGLCRTLSSMVAMVTPLLAAWIISLSGGISVSGLRPLYGIQLGVFVVIFILLAIALREPARVERFPGIQHMASGFKEIFHQGSDAVRMMLMLALMEIPWSMAQPFMPLFAHEHKGADEFVLGGMAVAYSIAPLLISLPIGWLADRFGRKRILFVLAPLTYAANLLLIFSGSQAMLLSAGLFFGFNSIAMAVAAAMTAEIVSQDKMGRWIGMVSLVRGLMSIPAPTLGGIIWDTIGPQYVFVAAIGLDLLLRLPLLASMKETLHLTRPTA